MINLYNGNCLEEMDKTYFDVEKKRINEAVKNKLTSRH